MMKQALTIAGSDSGSGAGIQADLKSFHANGVYGLCVVTSITAQNTYEITKSFDLPPEIIEAQLDAVFSDYDISAAKTGMLSSKAAVEVVASRLRDYHIQSLVVDPVSTSKSGFPLLRPEALETLRYQLLPIATLVTPNVSEAELLAKTKIVTTEDFEEAARIIAGFGARNVLIKGGHLVGDHARDLLFDGQDFISFDEKRIGTNPFHGTGCTLSAAITAYLALGKELTEAITSAKRYVTEAIRGGLDLGKGYHPLDHFYFLQRHSRMEP